jgi:hypothetical protein
MSFILFSVLAVGNPEFKFSQGNFRDKTIFIANLNNFLIQIVHAFHKINANNWCLKENSSNDFCLSVKVAIIPEF